METDAAMKIVLIGPVPPYRGGIAHFTASLASAFENQGHNVLTISYKTQYPKLLYPGKNEKDFSQAPFDAQFLFSSYNIPDWRKTLTAIKSFETDLVIYPWWVSVWAPATAWLLRRLRKAAIPVKVLVHNTLPHEENLFDKILTRWALGNVTHFVTMTDRESDRLRKVVGDQKTIQTAPHPVYQQFPSTGLSKSELRQQLNLPVDLPLALFFGFVRPYKGLGILIDALAILKQKKVNLHVVVSGEFWESRTNYENQIKDLEVEDMITLHDRYIPDSEAGLYFEAADLFVAPYLDGTQSGSIKQAMGYNLRLVVSDVITDPLILANPAGCRRAPAGDAAALAIGIEKALSNNQTTAHQINFQESWQDLLDVLTDPSPKAGGFEKEH